MIGAEIEKVLLALEPFVDPYGFMACPLQMVSGCIGNPEPSFVAEELGWPDRICGEVAEAFDSNRWPDNEAKKRAFYEERFTLAIRAGIKACGEHDNPGSTW